MSSVGSGSHLCAVIDLRPVTFLEHCFALSLVLKVIVLGTWKWPINVPCSAVLWQQSTCQPTAGQSRIRASSDTIQFASSNTVHVKSHNQNIGNIQQSIWDINYFVVFVVAQAPWQQHKCLNFKISLYLIVNVPCLTGLLFCLFAYTLQTHPKNKGDKEKTTIITINNNNNNNNNNNYNNNNNKNSYESSSPSSSSSSSSSTSSTYYTLFTKIMQLLN